MVRPASARIKPLRLRIFLSTFRVPARSESPLPTRLFRCECRSVTAPDPPLPLTSKKKNLRSCAHDMRLPIRSASKPSLGVGEAGGTEHRDKNLHRYDLAPAPVHRTQTGHRHVPPERRCPRALSAAAHPRRRGRFPRWRARSRSGPRMRYVLSHSKQAVDDQSISRPGGRPLYLSAIPVG
jgi:hypothetical protein